MNVWVTKYALSLGIVECELVERDERYCWVKWPGAFNGQNMFRQADCHTSLSEAENHALGMLKKKIASLENSVKKLRHGEIKVKRLAVNGSDAQP